LYNFFSKSQFIGKDIIFMPTCHSTNDIATDLYKNNKINEGTVVITGNQIAGRGQRGNRWESEPEKNLTCSIIFQPDFLEPSDNFFLNIYSSLGILDYLSEMENYFKIKWPNDIFYKNKKICGILIENSVKGRSIGHSVLGIGLNVNQNNFVVPGAISLSSIFSRDFDIFDELEKLSVKIEKRYFQLRNHELMELMTDYLHHMYWINEKHTFFDQKFFNGTIIGISTLGKLQINTDSGIKEYGYKEVRFIR
jgi:BirA family transcriptional regulator, biotin operon repressor / biotin---[acetyl-CoA-carboxylase] ligase